MARVQYAAFVFESTFMSTTPAPQQALLLYIVDANINTFAQQVASSTQPLATAQAIYTQINNVLAEDRLTAVATRLAPLQVALLEELWPTLHKLVLPNAEYLSLLQLFVTPAAVADGYCYHKNRGLKPSLLKPLHEVLTAFELSLNRTRALSSSWARLQAVLQQPPVELFFPRTVALLNQKIATQSLIV